MDQNFEIRILWFLRIFFLKFSKRRRAVPLRPIRTIMVAAKLDQSRVLVTKFRQNRLTLKGKSAGQRHTDRQTRLKIMAVQVCNLANRQTLLKLKAPQVCNRAIIKNVAWIKNVFIYICSSRHVLTVVGARSISVCLVDERRLLFLRQF